MKRRSPAIARPNISMPSRCGKAMRSPISRLSRATTARNLRADSGDVLPTLSRYCTSRTQSNKLRSRARVASGPRSISGHALGRGRLMRLVYLDEAGISNELHEPYLVVAGAIVNPDLQWRLLEARFASLTKKYFPRHEGHPVIFHAKDIWHGTKLFDRSKWSLPKRLRLLDELSKIPAEFKLPIVMGYLYRPAARQQLAQLAPEMSKKDSRSLIHAVAFLNAIRRVENWMIENTDEVAMAIVEDTQDVKNTIRMFHRSYTDPSFRNVMGAFHSSRMVDTVH